MASRGGSCLYKEARLNLEPAYPGSTIAITLPANTTSTFGSRIPAKRTVVTESYADQDEEAFARRHLASDGSMFFRTRHPYPRSFLWRLLDNRKALEIQSVDLDQDVTHKFEANLTILLQFPSPIRPFGIAFAEPEDHDALTVFAISTANELYTLTLRRTFFIDPVASEQDIGEWCKRTTPTLFNLNVPYRLVAVSDSELLVSLDDGKILRLTKENKDDVKWQERYYEHSSWRLGGLLSWKGRPKVRFDNVDLDGSAAAAVALSPDRKHIFTVLLDHRIRIWPVPAHKPSIEIDLLGEPDRSNEKAAPYFIGSSYSTLLQVVDIPGSNGAEYHLVTYSPKQHQFKFWAVVDADDAEHGLRDLQSEIALVPPVDDMMNTTVWTLEEFHINLGPAGWKGTELWIRARSGPSSKVYSLKFDINDGARLLTETWKSGWVSVDSGPLTIDGLRLNPANPAEQVSETLELDPTGLTEKWLDFLFYPGRFTTATLETALVIFRKGISHRGASTLPRHGSLKERICASLAALVNAAPNDISSSDGYEEATSAQWQAFYGLVKDLHRRRGEYLSLTFDRATEMPWLVQSDHLAGVRTCSDAELIELNAATLSPSRLTTPLRKALHKPAAREVSNLLKAAGTFRKTLPASFQQQFQQQIAGELLQTQSLSVIDRMEQLEAISNLSQQFSDDDIALLVEELGNDVKDLTSELFFRAMETLSQELQGQTNQKKQVTRFGLKAILTVSQETLEMNHSILLDLLVLILFMQFEEDISEDFDASDVFTEIVNQLKDNLILTWLVSTAWAHQSPTGMASSTLFKTLSERNGNSKKFPMTQTVMEGIFAHRAFDSPIPRGLKAELLTYWSRVWLAFPFSEQTFDAALEDIMMILLQQNEYGLALDFSKFLPEESWTTYLKGRMHIALGEYTLASICFQKAAHNLALGLFNIEDADTVSFIKLDERGSFSDGLPRYYQHVLGLFEKVKAQSYVAEFANLALRSLVGTEEEALKSDVLLRLFNSSLQTSRFDNAYSALSRISDAALQRSALQSLVNTMVKRGEVSALLKFPFIGLIDEVDAALAHNCQNSLNIASGPPYHQILYSFRISRNNFRGAATILYERLQRLKSTSSKSHDPEDESLVQCYLMIINTLSSVSQEEAYILAESRIEDNPNQNWIIGHGKKMRKRQVITLDTLRKEYQAELDRVAAIESGQYPFVDGGDEMDIL
ncbi:nucleoporin Nup120/160-domain-containing protein [Lophiotrema nucula]|uniref:Nucleoporin Nup120/160-domain-containing protein n=1 Tax=Lophiotrema nucula TaxID=690887 RepID=A0A6A5ZLD6_9PLEO|nr:nucleoporin Nup120/160-domain-containing protein [Lophiotrema nucula]